jgi:hypothetical protein
MVGCSSAALWWSKLTHRAYKKSVSAMKSREIHTRKPCMTRVVAAIREHPYCKRKKRMKSLAKKLAVLTLLVGVASTPALAAETGGVKIKGKVNQELKADNVVNAAVGFKAKAGLSAASIHNGANVGGDVKQTVKAKNLVNAAVGFKTQACMEVASIGDNPACR